MAGGVQKARIRLASQAVGCIAVSLALMGCGRSTGAADQKAEIVASEQVEWQEPVTVARGDAYAGSWRMNESEFRYVDDASVALRDDGEAAMVWVDNERQDVFLHRYTSGGQPRFERPVNVSRSPTIFSWLPLVLFGDDDRVYVAWQEIVFSGGSHGGEIFFARSTDGGQNFSAPINLSQTTNGAGKGRMTEQHWDNGSLDMAMGAQGEIVVAWTEYQGALRLRRSTDGGVSFSPSRQVGGSDQRPARGPSLAYGPDRNLYLAWALGEDLEANIQLAHSTDGGQSFGIAQDLHPSNGYSDTPDLAVDPQGQLHLIYAESSGGFFAPSQLRYSRLGADGDPVGQARLLHADSTDSAVSRSAPSIALDQQGRVLLVWEHREQSARRARGLGLSVSVDGGDSFFEPAVVPGSRPHGDGINGSLQGELGRKLSVNKRGGVAVANSQFRQDEQSRIVLIRGQLRP